MVLSCLEDIQWSGICPSLSGDVVSRLETLVVYLGRLLSRVSFVFLKSCARRSLGFWFVGFSPICLADFRELGWLLFRQSCVSGGASRAPLWFPLDVLARWLLLCVEVPRIMVRFCSFPIDRLAKHLARYLPVASRVAIISWHKFYYEFYFLSLGGWFHSL